MMSRRAMILAAALAVVSAAPGFVAPAQGQLFSYDREAPRPVQAVTAVAGFLDFNYAGGGDPEERFDFSGPAFGATYSRPSVHISVLMGRKPADSGTPSGEIRLIDAALFTWGEIGLSRAISGGRHRLFVPILLHSGHRRAAHDDAPESAIDAFSVTVLGIGTGIGFGLHSRKLQLEGRLTPLIGIATRSFGDATGSSTMLDADVQLHVGPVVGRFGLSFGYGFRAQRWNVGASELLDQVEDGFFDYSGSLHSFRAGVSF